MDPLGDKTGKYGGSVREAGGSLGALGASREDQWAREQDAKLIEQLASEKQADKSHDNGTKSDTHWTNELI